MSGNIPGYILALKNRNKRKSDQENQAQLVLDYQNQENIQYPSNNYNFDCYNDSEHFSQKKAKSRKSFNDINKNAYKNKQYDMQNLDSSSYQTRFSSPESQISIPADEFTEEEIKPHNRSQNNISDFDEATELRQVNRELQNEIHELGKEIQRLRAQLKQKENEYPEDFQFTLQKQKDINTQLQIQLDKAQTRITQLEQIINIKEDSIQKMTSEFQAASATLKDHMDIMSSQSSQLEQANSQILSLKIELERYKRGQQDQNSFPNRLPLGDYDDKMSIRSEPSSYQDPLPVPKNDYIYNYNNNPINDLNSPPTNNYKSYQSQPQFQSPIPSSTGSPNINNNQYQTNFSNHPAMRDNLRFGDDQPPPPLEFDVETMSDDEIRTKLSEYQKIKGEIEWKLNRVPPKAANMSHVRAEREKMEEEVDQLHRKVSKLKYEMKKRHIF
ncbi:hypothetical protein M9Y10_002749 [Tritrichomonas musculus]|uniref:Enkurin domain-containing protein n=1 Tax=Tritrichomonas musculus TaxID=1915356 RepID=A0ABR2LC35_9EUKA